MEAKHQLNLKVKYFGHESRFSNFLLKSALVVVIGQQIYFPQTLKYFHLAILFTYMIFLEFFKDDRRAFYEEYALVASILGCSGVSIIEKLMDVSLPFVYMAFLYSGVFLTIKLLLRINRIIRKKQDLNMLTEKNQKMLIKGTSFMKILTASTIFILCISIFYGLYELIRLF